MSHWYILKIDKTDDKETVKAAYMSLLPKHNPEDDPDGFANLRLAYEEALKEIDQKVVENISDDPVSIFFAGLEELYKDFERRILPAAWEEALKSNVCIALDTEEEVDAKMLEFLSRNHCLPMSVWAVLNNRFRWVERAEELRSQYNPEYINSIVFSVNNKFDFHYELFDYNPESDVDRFIFACNSLTNAINSGKKEEAESLFEEIKTLGVQHPTHDLELARYQIFYGDAKKALCITNEVMQKYPILQSEPFPMYVKATALLAIDDKTKLEEALDTYKRALEIVPDYYVAQLGLVDVLVKQEEFDKAEDYLAEVIVPENPSNGYIYSYLEYVAGLKLEKYETLFKRAPTLENIEKLAECYAHARGYDKCIEFLTDKERSGNVCYLLGGCYFERKEYDKAIKFLLESIEKDPKYSRYLVLSDIYIIRRWYEKAIETVEAGIDAGLSENGAEVINKAGLISNKAYAYNKLGRYEQALESVDEAIAINSQMCDVYANKAEIYINMGKLNEAFTEIDIAMRLVPNWVRCFELQAEIFYMAENDELMAEVLDKADELKITSYGLTFYRGCLAGNSEDIKTHNKCFKIFQDLLSKEDLGIWEEKTLSALYDFYLEDEKYDCAVLYAEKLIEFYKKNGFTPTAYLFTNLADSYRNLGDSDKALDAIDRGLEALPNDAELLVEQVYYYEDRNSSGIVEAWQRVIEAAPKVDVPYNRIAMLLNKEEKHQEALDILNQGLSEIPGSINLLGRRGHTYLCLKRYQEAADDFLETAENPKKQFTWWDIGVMYIEAAYTFWTYLNNAEDATKYYFMAEESGLIEKVYDKTILGSVYQWRKDYDKAIEIFNECIDNDPTDDFALFSRGYIYKQLGEDVKAQADFEWLIKEYEKIDKKSHDVYRLMGCAYLEMDMSDDAKDCFEKSASALKTEGVECFCVNQSWAKYYKYLGNYQKALEQIELAIGIANSVINNTLKREITLSLHTKE